MKVSTAVSIKTACKKHGGLAWIDATGMCAGCRRDDDPVVDQPQLPNEHNTQGRMLGLGYAVRFWRDRYAAADKALGECNQQMSRLDINTDEGEAMMDKLEVLADAAWDAKVERERLEALWRMEGDLQGCPESPIVGRGATAHIGSDRYGYVVVSVSEDRKTARILRLRAPSQKTGQDWKWGESYWYTHEELVTMRSDASDDDAQTVKLDEKHGFYYIKTAERHNWKDCLVVTFGSAGYYQDPHF